MKIACIATSRIPSDTANSIQVMKACQALTRLGHAVHLFVPRWPGTQPAEWSAMAEHYGLSTPFEITWLPVHPRLNRNDFAFQSVQRARALHADLVYTWAGQSAVFALLRGLPVLYEIHDLPTGKIGPLWFQAFRRLPGRKRLLPITHALLQALQSAYGGFPTDQVVIAPNGVDLEQYSLLPSPERARRELDLPEGHTVLCSGHLYAGRGVDLFLMLAARFPQASFVWVGGRPEEVDYYRMLAQRDGLANVTFTGFIPQKRLPCYQAAADVLLMPYARSIAGSSGGNSAAICSPMKMFDYLAAGRAILSSDLPVVHEVLNDSNALFAAPEDLNEWTAALTRLLSNDALRLRLSDQARADAQSYSWQARAARALQDF